VAAAHANVGVSIETVAADQLLVIPSGSGSITFHSAPGASLASGSQSQQSALGTLVETDSSSSPPSPTAASPANSPKLASVWPQEISDGGLHAEAEEDAMVRTAAALAASFRKPDAFDPNDLLQFDSPRTSAMEELTAGVTLWGSAAYAPSADSASQHSIGGLRSEDASSSHSSRSPFICILQDQHPYGVLRDQRPRSRDCMHRSSSSPEMAALVDDLDLVEGREGEPGVSKEVAGLGTRDHYRKWREIGHRQAQGTERLL